MELQEQLGASAGVHGVHCVMLLGLGEAAEGQVLGPDKAGQ